MNYNYINENYLYPFYESLFREGIFVLWKLKKEEIRAAKPTWHANMLWDYKENKEFFNRLCFEGSVTNYFGLYEGTGDVDYVAISRDGEILKTNFDAVVTTDSHGVMKITAKSKPDLRHFVLPADSSSKNGRVFFINGENLKELNKSADRVVLNKIIKKPKNYKKGKGIITEFSDYEPSAFEGSCRAD